MSECARLWSRLLVPDNGWVRLNVTRDHAIIFASYVVLQVDNETALFFEPVTWGMVLDGECSFLEILPASP